MSGPAPQLGAAEGRASRDGATACRMGVPVRLRRRRRVALAGRSSSQVGFSSGEDGVGVCCAAGASVAVGRVKAGAAIGAGGRRTDGAGAGRGGAAPTFSRVVADGRKEVRAREKRSACRCVFWAVGEPEDVVARAFAVRDVRGRAFLYKEVANKGAICGDLSVLQSFSVLGQDGLEDQRRAVDTQSAAQGQAQPLVFYAEFWGRTS
eukprot:6180093-Pleurochrysis_carterae.AAC.3